MDSMVAHLQTNKNVTKNTDQCFCHGFKKWLITSVYPSELKQMGGKGNERRFYELLKVHLYSDHGRYFLPSITFSGDGGIQNGWLVVNISPTVVHGGMSTLLAFVQLAASNGFLTFFKVCFLTIMFGLFHGLVCTDCLQSSWNETLQNK